MSTTVTYSDGTSEVLSDSEVDNMAPEIQKNVTNLEPVADTQIPYLPTAGNENGQTTLEKVDAGNPIANLDQTITNGLNTNVVQPVKEYVNSFGQSITNPAAPMPVQNATRWAIAHPGSTAAILGSLFIPGLSPVTSGVLGAGGVALDKLHPFDSHPNEWTTESGLDNGVDVAGSGLGMGLGTWGAGKLFGRVGEVFGRPGREQAAYKAALPQYQTDVNDIAAENAINKQQLGDVLKAAPDNDRAKLNAIKDHMLSVNAPQYQEFGNAYYPSDKEALDYYNSIYGPADQVIAPTPAKGMNITRMLPNSVRYGVEGVLGGEQGLFGGKLYPAVTDNFFIPKVVTAGNTVVAKPATLASRLGGYALGSNASAVPDAVQLLKDESDKKKKRLQLLNRFSK